MKDDLKAKLFYELHSLEAFKAQLELEDETITALQSKLLTIDGKSNVEFEYARARGAIEVLLGFKAKREHFLEAFRSRLRNS